jgi:hypothetical protein
MKINVTNGFVLIERSVTIEGNIVLHFYNNNTIGSQHITCTKDEVKENINNLIDILNNDYIEHISINECIMTKEHIHLIVAELMNITCDLQPINELNIPKAPTNIRALPHAQGCIGQCPNCGNTVYTYPPDKECYKCKQKLKESR